LQGWTTLAMNVKTKVIFLLMILTLLGIFYNIVSQVTDKPTNFNICPLCEEPTNEQRFSTLTF
jgi:hypothetical protein